MSVSAPSSVLAGPAVVHSDPEIMGGTPVFVGTRVPVEAMFDYLVAGDSLNRFLNHFPTVSREQAIEALELARQSLLEIARVRVLFDESMPRPFARELAGSGHEIRTVRQMRWTGLRNGELLRQAAEAGFGGLVSVDRSIEHQ